MNKIDHHSKARTYLYTFAALVAFAANSVLCRLALKDGTIDPAGFTSIRLLSGIVMFLVLGGLFGSKQNGNVKPIKARMFPALMLFIYACAFSYAYVSIDTGVGALVLFGAVQLTMICSAIFRGEPLNTQEWLGIVLSFSGLFYLVYPSLSTPSLAGFILMTVSGVAWGFYTLAGRGSQAPFFDTANNFKLTLPLLLVFAFYTHSDLQLSQQGILLAVLSGAIASACGYTIWYSALKSLETSQAAVVQLSVPILAAIGGVIFVAEPVTLELFIASGLVLGGILIVILAKKK